MPSTVFARARPATGLYWGTGCQLCSTFPSQRTTSRHRGNYSATSPAGRYLSVKGVEKCNFNTYEARYLGNIRLQNRLLLGKEGYYTVHLPDGEETTMYEASERYKQEGVPLIVIAGKEYGSGSSRDWTAKGPLLLGVLALLKASSVCTTATSSAWASCHCSSNRAKTKSRSG
jgi:Aconitase C-terminal domain